MAGTFSLSVRDYEADKGDHVKHYRIRKTPGEKFFIAQRITFDTIAELVAHYQRKLTSYILYIISVSSLAIRTAHLERGDVQSVNEYFTHVYVIA